MDLTLSLFVYSNTPSCIVETIEELQGGAICTDDAVANRWQERRHLLFDGDFKEMLGDNQIPGESCRNQ